MKRLFVAGQDVETREWIPVAELREVSDGYELRYTKGSQRLPGFEGLSRMQSLYKTYFSRSLFPFFSNRLISKSRPEYSRYLEWSGLSGFSGSAMDLLSVTGGARATDSYELVAAPKMAGTNLQLEFFPRGLRYLPANLLKELESLATPCRAFLMKDFQNVKDPNALALRTESPSLFIGYLPRYYAAGLKLLLENPNYEVQCMIAKVNLDAPLDMRVRVSMSAQVEPGFELLDKIEDFQLLTHEESAQVSEIVLQRTNLEI